jgi:hypothetical protein
MTMNNIVFNIDSENQTHFINYYYLFRNTFIRCHILLKSILTLGYETCLNKVFFSYTKRIQDRHSLTV